MAKKTMAKKKKRPSDYVFLEFDEVAGPRQAWRCAGCGGTVQPGTEAFVFVSNLDDILRFVLVHVDCRVGMLSAGSWGRWFERIRLDPDEFDADSAREALFASAGEWPADAGPPPEAFRRPESSVVEVSADDEGAGGEGGDDD